MAFVVDIPPSAVQEVRLIRELEQLPAASGIDGRLLYEECMAVDNQWTDRLTSWPMSSENPDDASLRHVPFQPAGTIKVRFQAATPMKPRQIDVEDIDNE